MESRYKQERETCIDEVQGIALGITSVGGTVLANSRMGYWNNRASTSRISDRKGHSSRPRVVVKNDYNELYSIDVERNRCLYISLKERRQKREEGEEIMYISCEVTF